MTNVNRSLVWGITSLAIIAALSTLLTIRSGRGIAAQVEPHDFGSEMVKKVKQGRFDEAVQVGLQAIQNQPGDEFVYQQIADVPMFEHRGRNRPPPGAVPNHLF